MRSALDKGILSHVSTAFPTPWSSQFTKSDVNCTSTCRQAPWTETSGLAFHHPNTPTFSFGNCQGGFFLCAETPLCLPWGHHLGNIALFVPVSFGCILHPLRVRELGICSSGSIYLTYWFCFYVTPRGNSTFAHHFSVFQWMYQSIRLLMK